MWSLRTGSLRWQVQLHVGCSARLEIRMGIPQFQALDEALLQGFYQVNNITMNCLDTCAHMGVQTYNNLDWSHHTFYIWCEESQLMPWLPEEEP